MSGRISGRGWYILSTPNNINFETAKNIQDPSNNATYYNNIYYLNDPIENSVDISNGSWIILNKNTNPILQANRGYWVYVRAIEPVTCMNVISLVNTVNDN